MILDSLDLFFGDANPAEARVYARLNSLGKDNSFHLDGRLSGPVCDFARTLPAQIPFTDRSRLASCLAEAVIPDPCFWTPELPFLYRAQLELRVEKRSIGSYDHLFGLRRLGVRDRHLIFDGKRFVLRAVRSQNFDAEAQYAHETWTALIVENPSDELCEHASHHGVLIVADLTSDPNLTLRRLARWPAVGIALFSSNATLPPDVRNVVPNLLLAQYISGNHPLAPWAQLAFVDSPDLSKLTNLAVPIVAVRQSPDSTSIEQSRAACDALQSELSTHGDFAGYVV